VSGLAYHLERRAIVGGSVDEVFRFFCDPFNLQDLTPPWLGFRILDATSAVVERGTVIRYALRLQGFPLRWASRITEFEDGVMFADEQLTGPYRTWYHRHLFRPVAGGVEIIDRVEYTMPFGVAGRAAHALVVRHQLRAIFDYRAGAMQRRFPRRPMAHGAA
jgi:ligand-binding SRPBCC domain-containing protein